MDDSFVRWMRALSAGFAELFRGGQIEVHLHNRMTLEHVLNLGIRLGLKPQDYRLLELGAEMHDWGKLAVLAELRETADIRLSKDDPRMQRISAHTRYGYRFFMALVEYLPEYADPLTRLALICRDHHCRFDSGLDLPPTVRIVSVVDVFDAVTGLRGYRRPLSVAEALAEIERCAGSQLDPDSVRAFVSMMREGHV